MAYIETPPKPRVLPQYLVGAASPLWAYFGVAAAGGVAFWWMTRWAKPVNLEAVLAMAKPAAEPMLDAVVEAPLALVEAVEAAAPEPVAPEPVAPLMEVAPEPPAAPTLTLVAPVAEVLEVAPPEPVVAETVLEPLLVEDIVASEPAPVVEDVPAVAALAPEPPTEATADAYAWVEPKADIDFGAPEEPAPVAAAVAPAPKPRATKASKPKA